MKVPYTMNHFSMTAASQMPTPPSLAHGAVEGLIASADSSAANSPIRPRLDIVREFLDVVAPGEENLHCFQAIHDSDKSKAASPILHGSFAQHEAALAKYSADGYGIFWTVNATDGRGRSKENINRARAVWLDYDEAGRDTGPVEAALTPTCVVESSPGKHHLYWRVADLALGDFDLVLDALTAQWGGDIGAKGANRVLRLPGFAHQKNPAAPFMTRVVRTAPTLAAYAVAHLRAALIGNVPALAATALPTGADWTDAAEVGYTNAPASVDDLRALLEAETVTPRPQQMFGDDRTSAWLVNADPDRLPAGDDRSVLRMTLISRMVHRAGGNCELVRETALTIPLCVKDDREALLHAEILKARALFLQWWHLEKARRDAQLAEARAIGDELDEPILPVQLTMLEALDGLVYVEVGRCVADRSSRKVRAWEDATGGWAASRHKYADENGKMHNVALLPAWRAHPARKTVDVVTWAPGRTEFCEPPEAEGGNTRAFNTWRGLRALAPPANWREWVVGFEGHVAYLIPDEAQRLRFLQWLAHIVQRPGDLPHTCYLMIAKETGIGRNWLAGVLARVLPGNVAAGVALAPVLDGKFNGRLSRKLLATVDETREGMSEHRHARGEALKRLVTEENRLIDTKYGRQVVEFNCCRWLMFSNHDDALPFDNNDRRVVVIENPTERLSAAQYTWLYSLLRHKEFAASVRQLLATLDLSSFNAGAHAPTSEAKLRSLRVMTSGVDQAVQAFAASWPGQVAGRGDVRRFVAEDMGSEPNEAALRFALDRAGMVQSVRRIRVGLSRDRVIGLGVTLEQIDRRDPLQLAEMIRQAREKFQSVVPGCPG